MKTIVIITIFMLSALCVSSCKNHGANKLSYEVNSVSINSDSINKVESFKNAIIPMFHTSIEHCDIKYGDFDNNGTNEFFAVVSELVENNLSVSTYYVHDNGKIAHLETYKYATDSGESGIIDMKDEGTLLLCHRMNNMVQPFSRVYLLRNDKIKDLGEYDYITLANDNSLSILVCPTDASIVDDIEYGRTQHFYPIYLNNGKIIEYGGMEISINQLIRLTGGQSFVEKIKKIGGEITNIYYRENGYVDINYSIKESDGSQYNYYFPCIIDENEILTIRMNPKEEYSDSLGCEGIMQKVHNKDNATFPKSFPYRLCENAIRPTKEEYENWRARREWDEEAHKINLHRFNRKSDGIDYYVMETSDDNGADGPVVLYLHSKYGVDFPNKMLEEWTINSLIWYFDLQGTRAKIIVPISYTRGWNQHQLQSVMNIVTKEKNTGINDGRLFILGESDGGTGVWNMLNLFPNYFNEGVSKQTHPLFMS